MIVSRNGQTPQIHPTATIAASAQIVGNVTIGEYSFIDYNVVIESSGPPIHIADQRTPILAAMLKDAAINAPPMKYTQNIRPGMYFGTRSLTNPGPKRWSAPKTARGIAKYKLLKATILSRPRASAISFFAAHTPIKKARCRRSTLRTRCEIY
jgi:hypothetical protein